MSALVFKASKKKMIQTDSDIESCMRFTMVSARPVIEWRCERDVNLWYYYISRIRKSKQLKNTLWIMTKLKVKLDDQRSNRKI